MEQVLYALADCFCSLQLVESCSETILIVKTPLNRVCSTGRWEPPFKLKVVLPWDDFELESSVYLIHGDHLLEPPKAQKNNKERTSLSDLRVRFSVISNEFQMTHLLKHGFPSRLLRANIDTRVERETGFFLKKHIPNSFQILVVRYLLLIMRGCIVKNPIIPISTQRIHSEFRVSDLISYDPRHSPVSIFMPPT